VLLRFALSLHASTLEVLSNTPCSPGRLARPHLLQVEVKLRLEGAEAHTKVAQLLAPCHVATFQQVSRHQRAAVMLHQQRQCWEHTMAWIAVSSTPFCSSHAAAPNWLSVVHSEHCTCVCALTTTQSPASGLELSMTPTTPVVATLRTTPHFTGELLF
jgi:hypothetical protein